MNLSLTHSMFLAFRVVIVVVSFVLSTCIFHSDNLNVILHTIILLTNLNLDSENIGRHINNNINVHDDNNGNNLK